MFRDRWLMHKRDSRPSDTADIKPVKESKFNPDDAFIKNAVSDYLKNGGKINKNNSEKELTLSFNHSIL